jgi:SAM-dependent methyltransferase
MAGPVNEESDLVRQVPVSAGADAVARFDALLSPDGREVLEYLAGRPVTGDMTMRLATELRARYPAGLVADALTQHELRLRAAGKFDRAMRMFFTRQGLEQASAEVVARHRAARYAGSARVADLCCGVGGDLLALAEGRSVLAVDRDLLRVRVALANAGVYGVRSRVRGVQADVREISLRGMDAVFIDPARRTGSRRLRAACSDPPLSWGVAVADRVRRVGIKAAPGLPHDAVPGGWEAEFVAVGRELKEAAAWSPALATARRRATILPEGHTLVPEPGPAVPVRMPGEYLVDPNPAVTRAGVVAELARSLGAWQVDAQIAFLSADFPLRTPFGRTLRIIDSAPWNQKQLSGRLRALDIGAVDIRRRGLAGDVGRLYRGLKLTGTRRATVVMTRVRDRPWGLICLDMDQPGHGRAC